MFVLRNLIYCMVKKDFMLFYKHYDEKISIFYWTRQRIFDKLT